MARPRTPLLSEEKILAAVRRLGGENDFTLAQLARELDVRVSSIYHHVPSKSAVVHLLRRDWVTQLGGELGESRGRDRLQRVVYSYAGFINEIPALIPLLISEPLEDDELSWLYEELARTLRELDVPIERVLPLIRVIDGLVLGLAFDRLSPRLHREDLSATAHPNLLRALVSAERDGVDADPLRSMLNPILDGVLGLGRDTGDAPILPE